MSSRGIRDRGPRKSAFSCEPCRKRKVKCDARQPMCLRCDQRPELCEYRLNPTLSYTQRLENRIRELETQLSGASDDAGLLDRGSEASTIAEVHVGTSLPMPTSSEFEATSSQISHHGLTNFLESVRPSTDDALSAHPIQERHHNDAQERSEDLVMHAWQQRALETFSATPQAFQYLLNYHWTWIQPVFNFVYRPAFTRDMDLQGPYFSYALLAAILAHSARWRHQDPKMREYLAGYEDGAIFARHACVSLHDDLREGRCGIPTIQACLLISASECSKGSWTQAWMYSGIAFRLVSDHGIDVQQHTAALKNLSEVDIEVRKRLFWSCYFWDKVICLYLGRCPSIQRTELSPTLSMLDDSAEEEMWIPYGIPMPTGHDHPPRRAHSLSSFKWICRLSEILNELLLGVYNPLRHPTQEQMNKVLNAQKTSVQKWWHDLPDFLRIAPSNIPAHCQPSHIVTLNALYHTVNILAHRPLLSNRNKPQQDRAAVIECLSSATAITNIFSLFGRSFGEGRSIMALSYSVYIATSVFLLQVQAVKPPDPRMLERLMFCIESLETASTANAVLQHALNMVMKEAENLGLGDVIALRPKVLDYLAQGRQVTDSDSSRPLDRHMDRVDALANQSRSANIHLDYFDIEGLDVSQDMLDALADIEPMSAYVGLDADFTNAGTLWS